VTEGRANLLALRPSFIRVDVAASRISLPVTERGSEVAFIMIFVNHVGAITEKERI